MTAEPGKIGRLIVESLQKRGFAERLKREAAVVGWKEIVGKQIATESEALRIDRDTLVVKVRRAAWRQELSFMKADILTKINRQLGGELIKDIRFV